MKRLPSALGILCCALLLSCGNGDRAPRDVPENVLSKDSMAFYLSQVHLIDAAMRHRDVRKYTLQSYAKRSFIEYFDTACISRDQFQTSLEFWGKDFEEMADIYDLSMERLSTRLAKVSSEELIQEQKEKEDSVANQRAK